MFRLLPNIRSLSVQTRVFSGPGTPTIVERIFSKMRIPYGLGCALAGISVGAVLPLLMLRVPIDFLLQPQILQSLIPFFRSVSVIVPFLSIGLYLPGYVRRKVNETKSSLEPLLELSGGRDFAWAFRPLSGNLLSIMSLAPTTVVGVASSLAYPGVNGFANGLFFSVFIFAFFSSAAAFVLLTLGMRRLGSLKLSFRPYFEDRFLGLKPMGSLGLSCATVYFGMAVFGMAIAAFSWANPSWTIIFAYGLFGEFAAIGLVAFARQMFQIHRKMTSFLAQEKDKLDSQFADLVRRGSTLDSTRDIVQIMLLNQMRRDLSKASKWPFDTRTIVRTIVSMLLLAISSGFTVLFSRLLG